jgi:hypothetical protein
MKVPPHAYGAANEAFKQLRKNLLGAGTTRSVLCPVAGQRQAGPPKSGSELWWVLSGQAAEIARTGHRFLLETTMPVRAMPTLAKKGPSYDHGGRWRPRAHSQARLPMVQFFHGGRVETCRPCGSPRPWGLHRQPERRGQHHSLRSNRTERPNLDRTYGDWAERLYSLFQRSATASRIRWSVTRV